MSWFQTLVSPVTEIFKSWNGRKKAKEQAKAKLAMLKESNDAQVQFTNQEWQAMGKMAEGSSWKDEWVTVIMTLPIPFVFIAAIVTVLSGNPLYLESVLQGIEALKVLLPNYGDILEVVVYAAVSILGVKTVIK